MSGESNQAFDDFKDLPLVNPGLTKSQLLAVIVAITYLLEEDGKMSAPPCRPSDWKRMDLSSGAKPLSRGHV
jgi:hypothetical protein